MKTWTQHLLQMTITAGVLVALAGCGSEAGNPKKPKTSPQQSLLVDRGIALEVLSAQVDDSIDAATSELSGELSGAFELSKSDSVALAPPPSVSCSENSDQSATVRIERSGQANGKIKRKGAELDSSWEGSSLTLRTWKHPNLTISCENARARVRDWSGVILTTEHEHDFRRVIKAGDTVLRSIHRKGSGRRELTWDSASLTNSQHSVRGDSTRTLNLSGEASGGSSDVSSKSLTTKITGPLVIKTERTRGAWVSRTITTGEVQSELAGDARVDLALENIQLNRSEGCSPVAGRAQGTVVDLVNGTTLRSFEIDFATLVVQWSDGTTSNYVSDSCAIEEDGSASSP